MTTSDLSKPSERFNTPKTHGFAALADGQPRVDRKGGDFGAGVIFGVSVITVGEALGHEAWVDQALLTSVHAAINSSAMGVKSRFTHPSLSADGFGKQLGKLKNSRLDGEQAFADLHLSPSAHETPDGNLARYLMDMAEDHPEDFGLSISFSRDAGAEEAFRVSNLDAGGKFRSPDARNEKNFRHFRLAKLHSVDAVDEPAANPNGLFHRQADLAAEMGGLMDFALGVSDELPAATNFDVDPTRLRGFVERHLSQHGMKVVSLADADKEQAEAVAKLAAAEQAAASLNEKIAAMETTNAAEKAELAGKVADLESQVATLTSLGVTLGENDSLSASDDSKTNGSGNRAKSVHSVGANLDRVAASLKLVN